MAEVRLDHVTKRYGGVVALDDVSLTIPDGSFTSVFGPPGAGKSVMMRLLLGLEPVDAGRILIDGVDVTEAAPAERNLAMVFQNLALFPHLNARENIVFPLLRRRVRQDEIDARLDPLVGVLGIGHILHKKPAALSGGERQRVAIGRALIRDAAAYLMDEPIAALDARLRDTMRVELKRLQGELGRTFVYVSHDCDEAMSVADTMAILARGAVRQFGRPDDIYAAPSSLAVAELVGSPRINVLAGERAPDGVRCPFGTVPAASGRGPVTIAIRPEALEIARTGAIHLEGVLDDVERLGSITILTLRQDETRLRAIGEGGLKARPGDRIGLRVRMEGVHLFDRDQGERLP